MYEQKKENIQKNLIICGMERLSVMLALAKTKTSGYDYDGSVRGDRDYRYPYDQRKRVTEKREENNVYYSRAWKS